MSRPRRHNKGLPAYVRIRYGSYLFKDKKLCRVDAGEARMYEELAKRVAVGGTKVPALVMQFKSEFLGTLAPTSQVDYSRLLDIFAKVFAEFSVEEIEPHHIKASITTLFLSKGQKRQAKAYKSRVSTFFRWCIADKGLLKHNPCAEVRVPKPVGRKSAWTDELYWAMHERLNPMMQCYHELSYLLYQRTTDIRLLKWSQINNGTIHFQPTKTAKSSGKEVSVVVTAPIQAALDKAQQVAARRGRISWYVICQKDGTPYQSDGILSRYLAAERALSRGRLYLNPKALLPYAVTSAKRQGATLEQLKVGRAHSNISTTEGYIQQHDVPVSEVMLALPPRVLDKRP
jgi:hypothetical protein